MTDSIIKLTASDFDEAIAHLSLVFNDPNFAELVPSLYEPSDRQMRCNLALRRNGRIAAIVGVFPIDWVVGSVHLKLAGIGGVSVHPDFRGQGLMRLLMDAAMAEIKHTGYHAACLGGNRRRYGHWGFEKAGVEATFTVTTNSLEHAGQTVRRPDQISFQITPAAAADLPAMHALYRQQPIHCTRSPDFFPRHLHNWRRHPLVVRTVGGRVAGYACFDENDSTCVECCFESDAALEAFLVFQIGTTGKSLRLSVPLIRSPQFVRLEELSDDVSLIEASNWRIYDWPAVIGALLNAKHAATPLPRGTCVLKVNGSHTSESTATGDSIKFRMTVDDGASCRPSDDPPDFESGASQLLRALASPLPSELPHRAVALALWRPLPLMIPMQDRI